MFFRKQSRSRSAGFIRSQLIRIYTVFYAVKEFTILIEIIYMNSMENRSECATYFDILSRNSIYLIIGSDNKMFFCDWRIPSHTLGYCTLFYPVSTGETKIIFGTASQVILYLLNTTKHVQFNLFILFLFFV